MPDVKILSWNIFKFGKKVSSQTTRLNVILDLVNPVGGPAFDVFVVIEPVVSKGAVGSLATGDGPSGMILLKAALRGRSNADWQVVPPVRLASSTKREAMAVFYDAAKVKLKGPVDDAAITSATWRTTKTKGAGPGTFRGEVEFKDSANAAVNFPVGSERRPYFVTFETVSGAKTFSILAAHSPSPKYTGGTSNARNKQARQGTQKLGDIKEVTTAHRAHPVIMVADTNCCHPGHESPGGYNCTTGANTANWDKDEEARNGLTGQGFTSRIDGGTSLKGVSSSTATAYTNHAFDYLMTAAGGGTAVAVANAKIYGVGDLVTGYAANLNLTKWKPLFKRVRSTAGKGVSDHLPIGAKITLT